MHSHSRLTLRKQLALSALWLPLNLQYAALLPIVIPTQVLLFVSPGQVGNVNQAAFLGWLVTGGSLVSLFVPPIVGLFSDSTPSRFGRRRPYIVAGALLILVSTPMLAAASSVTLFLLGLSIMHMGKNVATAAYQSLLPDRVPEEQRGESSGYIGVMTILGNVFGLALAAWLLGSVSSNLTAANRNAIRTGATLFYVITAVTVLIGVVITVLEVHELPFMPDKQAIEERKEHILPRLRRWLVLNWVRPWLSFNFTIVFLTRFCIMLGLALFMTYIEYYFAQVEHITNFVLVTALVAVVALMGGVVSALVLGVLSDRFKRRAPVVSISTVCMGLAALAFVIFPSNLPLWPLGILFGLGNGAFTSVDWALSVDALPSINAVGKDMGLWSASNTLPAIVAPLMGSAIIAVSHNYGNIILGYRLVFATATIFLFIAAIFVLFVRESRTPLSAQKLQKTM